MYIYVTYVLNTYIYTLKPNETLKLITLAVKINTKQSYLQCKVTLSIQSIYAPIDFLHSS